MTPDPKNTTSSTRSILLLSIKNEKSRFCSFCADLKKIKLDVFTMMESLFAEIDDKLLPLLVFSQSTVRFCP